MQLIACPAKASPFRPSHGVAVIARTLERRLSVHTGTVLWEKARSLVLVFPFRMQCPVVMRRHNVSIQLVAVAASEANAHRRFLYPCYTGCWRSTCWVNPCPDEGCSTPGLSPADLVGCGLVNRTKPNNSHSQSKANARLLMMPIFSHKRVRSMDRNIGHRSFDSPYVAFTQMGHIVATMQSTPQFS